MFYVGRPSIQARRLCEVTFECLVRGIESVRPGAHLGDIGHAIQGHAESHGYSVVREFCGHGIGRKFHEEPQVLHYGRPGVGLRLEPGMTFTIEPMINAGRPDIRQLSDGWTVVTKDQPLGAVGTHGAGDRVWLRGAHRVERRAGARNRGPVYGDVTVKARVARDFKRTDSPFRGRIRLPMLVQPLLTSAGAPERGTGAGETLRGGPL